VSERERILDWVKYYRISPSGYNFNALINIYKNDGEKTLQAVLRELGMTASVELVKDAAKNV
jgi:hypothetical protein